MVHNRYSVLGMSIGLVVMILVVTVWAPRIFDRRRAESARECAQGVVAAAARGDILELESRFGREVTPSELAELRAQVPEALGADPKRYLPLLYSSHGDYSASVEVHNPSDPLFTALVTMELASPAGPWNVVSVQRVPPK